MEPCSNIPDGQNFERLIQLFKALSDPSRVKILFLIVSSAVCVGDIANKRTGSEKAKWKKQLGRAIVSLPEKRARRRPVRIIQNDTGNRHSSIVIENGNEFVYNIRNH